MAKKDYKQDKWISLICILGAIIGLVYAIIGISGGLGGSIEAILFSLLGIAFCVIVIIQVVKPDEPIPYHWVLFLVFGIFIVIWANLLGGIIVIIGAIVALIDTL